MSNKSRRKAEKSGRRGEVVAIFWLFLHGYRIKEVRYRTKTGEIDLIAARGKWLVFIEVKWRKLGAKPQDVTPFQADRIVRTAAVYLASHHIKPKTETRFDLLLLGPWHWPSHIKGAFSADSWGNRSIT